jgi:hypothetical protein
LHIVFKVWYIINKGIRPLSNQIRGGIEMITKLEDWNYRKSTGVIKRTILKRDLQRGVKFINEQAYSNAWGSTRSSALFCMELRKHMDLSLVYRVDMTQTDKHHYTVKLYTKDGYTIMLKGFSFGYWGEGSRGSMAALVECGFTPQQIDRIFTHGLTRVRMYKRVAS